MYEISVYQCPSLNCHLTFSHRVVPLRRPDERPLVLRIKSRFHELRVDFLVQKEILGDKQYFFLATSQRLSFIQNF